MASINLLCLDFLLRKKCANPVEVFEFVSLFFDYFLVNLHISSFFKETSKALTPYLIYGYPIRPPFNNVTQAYGWMMLMMMLTTMALMNRMFVSSLQYRIATMHRIRTQSDTHTHKHNGNISTLLMY